MSIAEFLKKISPIKRMCYYQGELLLKEDFEAEQNYHRNMRHLHNFVLHGSGIVWGLDVTKGTSDKTITVSPGVAIDPTGREIVLANGLQVSVTGSGNDKIYVKMSVKDEACDPPSGSGTDKDKRYADAVTVVADTTAVDPEAGGVLLAQFNLADGNLPPDIPKNDLVAFVPTFASLEQRLKQIEVQLKPGFYWQYQHEQTAPFTGDNKYHQFYPTQGRVATNTVEGAQVVIRFMSLGSQIQAVFFGETKVTSLGIPNPAKAVRDIFVTVPLVQGLTSDRQVPIKVQVDQTLFVSDELFTLKPR